MRFIAFAILMLPLTAFGEEDRKGEATNKVTVIGKVDIVGTLHTGIVAIGGETTGNVIKAGPIRFEIDVSANGAHMNFVEQHNGQKIRLTGTVVRLKGVERKERWIVTPDRLRTTAADANVARVKVAIKGKIRHGILAIGGETTGTTITMNGVTWELDLGKNQNILKLADQANGKKAVVSGTLKIRKGVEISKRWIVTVDEFCLSDD